MNFRFTNYNFDLLKKTYIMGILNVTPDSFSDGGKWFKPEKAIAKAFEIEKNGADIIDIGAQSTRPGFKAVSAKEEWNRLEPVLSAIKRKIKIPISIDTFYKEVAEKSFEYGVDIINDITGCCENDMFDFLKNNNCGIIINHNFNDLNIKEFFESKLKEAKSYGINNDRICFDPGIGFNKNQNQDAFIIKNLKNFKIKDNALLVGISRKRVIGVNCGNPLPKDRVFGTIAANTLAIKNGANIIRVHDVKEAVQASQVTDAILKA